MQKTHLGKPVMSTLWQYFLLNGIDSLKGMINLKNGIRFQPWPLLRFIIFLTMDVVTYFL